MAVSGIPEEAAVRIPALPERCPRCDGRGFNRDRETFFRGIVRSPVRAHTMGNAVGAQILVDRLLDNLGKDPAAARTIVFTDSRDDAASTAAGLELNHFRDLLRQLVRIEARSQVDRVALLRNAAASREIPKDQRNRLEQLKRAQPDVWAAYLLAERGAAGELELERIAAYEQVEARERGIVPWGLLLGNVEDRLVALGVNPAGPQPSHSKWFGENWWRYFAPPDGRAWEALDNETRMPGVERFRRFLATEVARAIFDRGGTGLRGHRIGRRHPKSGQHSARRSYKAHFRRSARECSPDPRAGSAVRGFLAAPRRRDSRAVTRLFEGSRGKALGARRSTNRGGDARASVYRDHQRSIPIGYWQSRGSLRHPRE